MLKDLKWTLVEKLNQHVLYKQRLVIRKLISDDKNYLLSPKLERLQEQALAQVMFECFSKHPSFLGAVKLESILESIVECKKFYKNRNLVENKGGSSFNGAVWLYVVAKIMQPEIIIDSGTFRGFSALTMKTAAPKAEVHSFDIEHRHLSYKHPDISYHMKDWSDFKIEAGNKRSLIFFDDHVSQARRVIEASKRGFKKLLFDDNFPATQLYATGVPAIPTLDMVMDERIEDGELLEWVRNGIPKKFICDKKIMNQAKDLIKDYAILPELSLVNGYGLQSGMSLAELV